MKMKKIILIISLLLAIQSITVAQKPVSQDERMEWWRDARFGMFIHWGLYSIPAGEWNGMQIPGIAEWIMKRALIPVVEYRQLASKFNPVKFNAHDFVTTAKNAGMKYITITSKHHDGFAMFKSYASNYNIVDATPYGKDVIKALADECQKQGLKLCFYYSQVRDWNEPNGMDNDWDFPVERDFQKYLDEKVKPQLTELLTNYGPIGMIWFDTPMKITKERAESIKELVRKLQPNCIISGRLGGGVQTDYFSTADNVIPTMSITSDWEVPATLNNTWGYSKIDQEWKSTEVITRMLFDIVSKGGNYLLNVGPTAEGVIPQQSVDILAKVGDWMKINGECIYETQASPYKSEFSWGNMTQKDNKLYLGIFDWPSKPFYLEGLKNKVKKVYLLSDKSKKSIPFKTSYVKKTNHNRLRIDLPDQAPDKVVSVVVIEIDGAANVENEICQQIDNSVSLPVVYSTPTIDGQPTVLKSKLNLNIFNTGEAFIWRDSTLHLNWNFKINKPGTYKINITSNEIGSHGAPIWEGGQVFKIAVAGKEITCTIKDDRREINQRSRYWKKVYSSGGEITFSKAGTYDLSLIPLDFKKGKNGFSFQEIKLTLIK